MISLRSALLFALLWFGGVAGQAQESEDETDPPNEEPFHYGDAIDDRAVAWLLVRRGEELIRSGRGVSTSRLLEDVGQRHCELELRPPSRARISSERLLAKHRASILVLAHLYKCDDCPRYHMTADTGFILTRSGAFATCYHGLRDERVEAIVALTGDGRVAPVVEVLAANPAADVVIMRLDGEGYTPLAVAADAPAGSSVRVISHPDQDYFSLTAGLISRYSVEHAGSDTLTRMAITAEFAKGSSGAPVLNEQGAVVGLVVSTRSIYYNEQPGRKDNLQMVVRHCVPSRYLLELIGHD